MCQDGGIYINSQEKKSKKNAVPFPYLVAASLANRLVAPAKEGERRMKDTYGVKCSASFARLDPDGLWQKTSGGYSQLTLDGLSEPFCQTWPKMGIVSDGFVMELEISAHLIEGKGSLSWRTPDANCSRGPSSEERMKWKLEGKWPISINDQVRHEEMIWPTPRAGNPGSRKPGTGGKILAEEAKKWPTPITTQGETHMVGRMDEWACSKQGRENSKKHISDKEMKGQLNPQWVECLQGFPQGWTETGPQEDGQRQEVKKCNG